MYLCIVLFLCTKYKPYTSWLSTAHCTSNFFVISHDIRTLSPFIFPNIPITHYSHYIPWISPWISPFMMLNAQGTTNIDVEKTTAFPFEKWSTNAWLKTYGFSHRNVSLLLCFIPITGKLTQLLKKKKKSFWIG